MKELTIVKQHNAVMDISIAYGLLSILNENDIAARLMNYPSAYIIEAEDFDAADLSLFKNAADESAAFNCMVSNADRLNLLKTLFGEDDEPGYLEADGMMGVIFSYYETLNEEILKEAKMKDTTMTFVGSAFDAKGQRKYGRPGNRKVTMMERYVSSLGYLRATSFVTINQNDEYTWLPIPSRAGVTHVQKLDFATYVDKETGEVKTLRLVRSNSTLTGLAHILLNIQYTLMQQNMLEQFDGVLTINTLAAGNRGLNGKVIPFAWLPVSEPILAHIRMNIIGNMQDKAFDRKHALANIVVQRTRQTLHNYAAIMNKENKNHDRNEMEELTHMVGLHDLYANEGVITLGSRLSQLMSKKKGYEIQVGLMQVTHKHQLLRVISKLGHIYNRTTGYNLWDNNDSSAFLSVVDAGAYTAEDIASAILLNANTWRERKKEEMPEKETSEATVNA